MCHSPHSYTQIRFIFVHRRNQRRSDNFFLSLPLFPLPTLLCLFLLFFTVENPPAVFYPIHMRGSCARDRVVDSEHGSRVPVPIQVASSVSRRIHHSFSSSCSSSSRVHTYRHAWILLGSDLLRYSLGHGRFFIRFHPRVPFVISRCWKKLQIFTTGKFPSYISLLYSLFLFFQSIYSPPQINSFCSRVDREMILIARDDANEHLIAVKLTPAKYSIYSLLINESSGYYNGSYKLNWIESLDDRDIQSYNVR